MNPTTLSRRAVEGVARITGQRTTVTLWLQPQEDANYDPSLPKHQQPSPPDPSEHVLSDAYVTPMDAAEMERRSGDFATNEDGGFRVSIPVGATDDGGDADGTVYGRAFPSPINGRAVFMAHINDQVTFPYAEGNRQITGRVMGDEPQDLNGGWYSIPIAVSDRKDIS